MKRKEINYDLITLEDLNNESSSRFPQQILFVYLKKSLSKSEELQTKVHNLIKEIEKLKQINSFLIEAQENRDKVISELAQENKVLRESIVSSKNQSNNKKAICLKPGKKNIRMEESTPRVGSLMMEKSMDLLKKTCKGVNFTQISTGTKTLSRIREEKMTHELILNMNIINQKESLKAYQEIKTIQSLTPILEEEDSFMTFITGSDYNTLLSCYDSLYNLYTDHRSLYSLVFRLKKIIKAANSMTETLVLSDAMQRIVDETCECLECDRASLFMLDEQKEELWTKAAKGTNTIRIPMNKGIVGSVATSGMVVNILNAYADERFNRDVDLKTNYKTNTILCLPITENGGRTIGVIQAINKFNGFFSKDDESLLTILANLAGIVLRNSISYDEQLLFHNSLRHILKSGIELNGFFSLEEVLLEGEKVLKNTLNIDLCRIFLVEESEEGKNLIRFSEENKERLCYSSNCGIAGWVAQNGNIESISNAYNHNLFNGQIDIETTLPIICMPIKDMTEKKIIAVIEVVNIKGIQGMSAFHKPKINHQDLEALEFFSEQLCRTIVNIRRWGGNNKENISQKL